MGFTKILPQLTKSVIDTQHSAGITYASTSARHMLVSTSGHHAAAFSTVDLHSSSTTALLLAEESDVLQSQQQVFEAALPDSSALVAMGAVLVLCVVAGFVWANEVVPVSRTKLAISKSRGEVRSYLDEIKADDEGTRNLEKWLFADWLNGRTEKDAAIPFLKKAKWNSGDNPVLVTSALLGLCVIVASITERISM
uniref:Uncharacterized protein n=1 Tax=Leptocylindrus danicus TaxID=163516 RepID=A0A7S2K224_9STRA|mmetsp:Transcript_15389/g.22728  ORF Transcript_15389/g.22728 Transcript_15389/m.22728 type:complete len:196 (+) Transcript_15389:104-691(+)